MSISEAVRNAVRERANGCCEYCRISADCVYAKMHIDHIEPQVLGGSDDENNLCFTCPNCNIAKGSLISALDPLTEQATPLFNPRNQYWAEHFTWANDRATILGLTACGRATVKALKINFLESLEFRRIMVSIGLYPP